MFRFRSYVLLNCFAILALPLGANAAGTYYTGSVYQPAQARYGQSGTYASSGYNNTNYARPATQYNNYATMSSANNNYQSYQNQNARPQQRSSQNMQNTKSSSGGFFANAGITHENAMWKLEMKNAANSILRYDDVAWNVFDVNGGYIFDFGSTKMQIDAGFKYGMQWDKANMIDDDISNGGYDPVEYWSDEDGDKEINPDVDKYIGTSSGHALSVGSSDDGNMLGFNVGFGLTDFFKWGNFRITPSVGYRYLKYKLETKNSHGLAVASAACFSMVSGEIQCDPLIVLYNTDSEGYVTGTTQVIWREEWNQNLQISPGYDYIDPGDTYYYSQVGVTHSYETEWSGPYIALDMAYDINQNNIVNGRVELGFPGYTSKGDQPYRWDWAHPTSVKDSADMFSALHLGLAANWKTAISNSVWLSLGLTYDYYSVSDADTDTYLNQSLYNKLVNQTSRTAFEEFQLASIQLRLQDCGGSWVCKSSKEVDSIYKSMGVRVGIDARF